MKLTTERLWWLRRWEAGGWTIGDPMRAGIKKWGAHTAALVKAGFLEGDDLGFHRITEAGRAALKELE
ncbi:hypothetical protein PRN20_18025 [Devosia sp. ZB163]|uniref:hypothetical protein n=1 Tax=Devosia sp. ZB163 TaxID=3025938 RepID=UPI00236036FE|nr:hypothetical protein [Devosia sp. ZB163]MDC9825635.1 hypothetical protein [Devosia sp. ZB163]